MAGLKHLGYGAWRHWGAVGGFKRVQYNPDMIDRQHHFGSPWRLTPNTFWGLGWRVWVGQLGVWGWRMWKRTCGISNNQNKQCDISYHISRLYRNFVHDFHGCMGTFAPYMGCGWLQSGKEDLDISRPQYGADVGAHVQKNQNKRNANGRQEVKRSFWEASTRFLEVFFSQTKRREKYERRWKKMKVLGEKENDEAVPAVCQQCHPSAAKS